MHIKNVFSFFINAWCYLINIPNGQVYILNADYEYLLADYGDAVLLAQMPGDGTDFDCWHPTHSIQSQILSQPVTLRYKRILTTNASSYMPYYTYLFKHKKRTQYTCRLVIIIIERLHVVWLQLICFGGAFRVFARGSL